MSMRPFTRFLNRKTPSALWNKMPLRVRWIACWPVLLCIYLAGFQISHIMANMLLQTVMRLHWSYALTISPILADILHMLIVLPAIRLLVPARQHLVVFGFALIVGIATLSAVSTLLAKDYLTAQPVWPSAYQLEDWYWRPFRDVINCIVVLAIVIWYGMRLHRHQLHRHQPHPH